MLQIVHDEHDILDRVAVPLATTVWPSSSGDALAACWWNRLPAERWITLSMPPNHIPPELMAVTIASTSC
ncbi:MAG: hypothetical protein NTW79_01670 [Candidatus Berkelbacteria bacterium]|nr:hypothetical protein [Candidatus Berkelbacteria bacterium]